MPITAQKLGPGSLTLGAGAMEVNMQLTACKVTPSESVTSTDRKKVLSGEVLAATDTAEYSYVLEGSFLQDLGAVSSVVEWSWANAGAPMGFTFVPNNAAGKQVSGQLVPVPLTVGGDEVDGPNSESSFTWRIVGTPDLEDVA